MPRSLLIFAALAVLFVLYNSCYTIQEGKQVILTQFGKPIGDPLSQAGLRFKLPFIQAVNRLEKRILEHGGKATQMTTRDKRFITVDTFARWRIEDPLQFFLRLTDERSAQSRLDDILESETRNAVAEQDLIEIIRSTKDRQPEVDPSIAEAAEQVGVLLPINDGRAVIEEHVFEQAAGKLKGLGIELLDIRFKRINYNQEVLRTIYDRMVSERQQIASRFRSEGEGAAARILGNKERELQTIQSEAYKQVQQIEGEADATATAIYAGAYNQSPDSAGLYEFVKTLEAYEKVLDPQSTLILSTNSELFHLIKSIEGSGSGPVSTSPLAPLAVPPPPPLESSSPPIAAEDADAPESP
ncbi:MAG TPA: protease modulator HflC [Verrucomicrobiales bacterium]|nr:protease modulator HflC [Verrucomicrobiales bacterium]